MATDFLTQLTGKVAESRKVFERAKAKYNSGSVDYTETLNTLETLIDELDDAAAWIEKPDRREACDTAALTEAQTLTAEIEALHAEASMAQSEYDGLLLTGNLDEAIPDAVLPEAKAEARARRGLAYGVVDSSGKFRAHDPE